MDLNEEKRIRENVSGSKHQPNPHPSPRNFVFAALLIGHPIPCRCFFFIRVQYFNGLDMNMKAHTLHMYMSATFSSFSIGKIEQT